MRNWRELVPEDVASKQASWDRGMSVARMRSVGLAFSEIARRLDISVDRVRQIHSHYRDRNGPSPVEAYLANDAEHVSEMVKQQCKTSIRGLKRRHEMQAAQLAADQKREEADMRSHLEGVWRRAVHAASQASA